MTIYQFLPTLDTYMDAANATTAFGGDNEMRQGTKGKSIGLYRMLTEIDISSIPAGSKIVAVQYTLWRTGGGSAGGGAEAGASRVNRLSRADWDAAAATYNIYKTANNWTTVGCGSTVSDYDVTNGFVNSSGPLATADYYSIITCPSFCAMTQDALDNQSGKLRLRLQNNVENTSNAEWTSFMSSEGAVANSLPLTAPQLTVQTAGQHALNVNQAVNRLAVW